MIIKQTYNEKYLFVFYIYLDMTVFRVTLVTVMGLTQMWKQLKQSIAKSRRDILLSKKEIAAAFPAHNTRNYVFFTHQDHPVAGY